MKDKITQILLFSLLYGMHQILDRIEFIMLLFSGDKMS